MLTSPIVRACYNQGSTVHYLTKAPFKPLLENNPYLDKVWTLEDKVSDLSREDYDLIIDLHKNLRSRTYILKLRKKSVSFAKLNLAKWWKVRNKKFTLPDLHIVDRMFRNLSPYGIKNDGKGLDFFISDVEKEKARELLPVNPYVCLVLGANYYTKRIPSEISEKIVMISPLPVVLIGGKDVQDSGGRLADLFPDKVHNLCGQASIGISAAILARAWHVVTGDTGMMHISAALQRPISVLWGSTVPAFGMGPYYGENELAPIHMEVKKLSCRPCSKLGHNHCPQGHFKCMMNQNVEEVFG